MIKHDDCMIWAGYKNEAGYGQMWYTVDGKPVREGAHRLSYRNFVGEIPEGYVIDHLCRVTSCINPDHLEAVTSITNTLRGIGFAGKNQRKTHCPRGHEYTEANVSSYSNKYRRCRTCENERNRKYYAEHREKWKVYNSKPYA